MHLGRNPENRLVLQILLLWEKFSRNLNILLIPEILIMVLIHYQRAHMYHIHLILDWGLLEWKTFLWARDLTKLQSNGYAPVIFYGRAKHLRTKLVGMIMKVQPLSVKLLIICLQLKMLPRLQTNPGG